MYQISRQEEPNHRTWWRPWLLTFSWLNAKLPVLSGTVPNLSFFFFFFTLFCMMGCWTEAQSYPSKFWHFLDPSWFLYLNKKAVGTGILPLPEQKWSQLQVQCLQRCVMIVWLFWNVHLVLRTFLSVFSFEKAPVHTNCTQCFSSGLFKKQWKEGRKGDRGHFLFFLWTKWTNHTQRSFRNKLPTQLAGGCQSKHTSVCRLGHLYCV